MKPKPTDAESRISRTLMRHIKAVEKLPRPRSRSVKSSRSSLDSPEFRTTSLDVAARVFAPTFKSGGKDCHYFPLRCINISDDGEPEFVFAETYLDWRGKYYAKEFAKKPVQDLEAHKRVMRRLEVLSNGTWWKHNQLPLFNSPTE